METLPRDLTTGSVLLDLGDGAGALILHTGAERLGQEIEIRRVGDDSWRIHAAVLRRITGGTTAYAVVFAGLPPGAYIVPSGDDAGGCVTVEVAQGSVAQIHL
jgi:hypothetical protein